MASPWLRRCDSFMRLSHLYTGLFLAPWMMVYAISGYCFNHRTWFTTFTPKSEPVREAEFHPAEPLPESPQEQAALLLASLDLTGPLGHVSSDGDQLTVYRLCAAGMYHMTWQRQTGKVVVYQQKPSNFYNYVNNLHFRSGFSPRFWPDTVWGLSVDVVTISTVLWVISGIWLWARRPRRLVGGACLAAGIALFAALAVVLGR